jgi:hypothetical protein
MQSAWRTCTTECIEGTSNSLPEHKVSTAGTVTEVPSLRAIKFVADTRYILVIERNDILQK